MKVTSISPLVGEIIYTQGDGSYTYQRWGHESWEIQIGDSCESVWDCSNLEEAYQEFKNSLKGG